MSLICLCEKDITLFYTNFRNIFCFLAYSFVRKVDFAPLFLKVAA